MDYRYIILRKENELATLSLNRPDVLNALNRPFIAEVCDALADIAADSAVRVLILRGEGRAFCAGDDLNEDFSDVVSTHQIFAAIERLQRVTALILSMRKIVVAGVHGHVVGAGLEWMMNCDVKVAAESTKFAMPETRWGYTVTNAGTGLLPLHVGMARAKEMVLLNRKIGAQEALEWGLVNKVVPDGELGAACREIASGLLANSQLALIAAKRALNENYAKAWGDVLASETKDAVACGQDASLLAQVKREFKEQQEKR